MGFLSGITSFVKEHSDVIHGVLDVAGFIPGVGAVADLANAGLYAAEGNWLEAGLSLASAVPGIGDTIALAKKSGKALKGLKGLKSLKGFNALDKAKGMKSLFGALKGKAKTGASKVKGWLKNRKEALKNIKKRLKGECVNGRCFTGDTLVYTRHGYKTIKEIQKGDEVYSRNAETGETGFKEVEEIFCTTAHTIYHVWIDGKEEIKTTAYHPVYVEGQGWVTAINLHEGDAIETMDGCAYITKIEKIRYEEPVPVYNFHVKEWASYFVGEVRIYVHNGKKHPVELEYSNSKNPMTGDDWHKYFNEKYGADNVTWESANIQDIVDMPSKITDFSPKQISDLAKRNGWSVEPLGKGSLAGIPYEKGGGLSMRAPKGSSEYIQYHPGGGHHGEIPYYKVSSGKNGTVRYYIDGKKVK